MPPADLNSISSRPWIRAVRSRWKSWTLLGLICLAIVVRLWTLPPKRSAGRAYYTIDDGKTFFEDSVHIPPYERYGSEAVGAMVFSCDGGATRFVGYLVRYSPEGKAQMESAMKRGAFGPPCGQQVKRPGDANWLDASTTRPVTGPSVNEITHVQCPGGNGPPLLLNP